MANDDLDLGETIRGFQPGQRVFNRYTLERLLGRGGMGVVWLARDGELDDRHVALKFLPEMIAMDKTAVADMKRETRRALELTHPNIVRIYDFVSDERIAGISMEYVDGDTLSALRGGRPGGVFEVAELAPWMEQLCGALEYAHTKAKVAHRDLKPANLMLTRSGEVKVADFGISATLTDTTTRVSRHAGSSGTPVYMSPQQMMGDKPSATDDVYSLGATLYELLTGKPPFHMGNILMQVQGKVPPTMAARRAELDVNGGGSIPECWEKAVAACLAKDAADRPQSMRALQNFIASNGAQPLELGARHASGAPTPASSAPARASAKPPVKTPSKPPAQTVRETLLPALKRHKWACAGALAALFAAALWQGDVINRVRAENAHRQSLREYEAGDYSDALRHARLATILRPGDPARAKTYESQQHDSLRRLAAQSEKLVRQQQPAQALALLDREQTTLLPLLDDRFAGQFSQLHQVARDALQTWVGNTLAQARSLAAAHDYDKALALLASLSPHASLVTDFAPLLAQTRENQVRHEVDTALGIAGKGNFDEAANLLATVSRRGLLPELVQDARLRVTRQAELACIETLCQALRQRDEAGAQKAIDRFSSLKAQPLNITASMLLAENDLGKFLASLRELQIAPADGAKRETRLDLVLVEALRRQFAAPDVSRFLARSYQEWSDEAAVRNLNGSALLLAGLAEKNGATLPSGHRAALLQKAARQIDARVHWAAPKLASSNLQSEATELLDELKKNLVQPRSDWLASAASPSDSQPSIGIALGAVETERNRQTSSRSVRYKSGTRQVSNPAYEQAMAEFIQAMANYSQTAAQANMNMMQASYNPNPLGAALGNLGASLSSSAVTIAGNRADQALAKAQNTPETLTENVYADESYSVIDHTLSHKQKLTVTFTLGDDSFDQSWTASKNEQSREVAGDASRGVPVERPSFLSDTTIRNSMAASFVGSFRDVELQNNLVRLLTIATSRKARTAPGATAHSAYDSLWCLRELWTNSGRAFPGENELRANLHSALDLPAPR